VGLTRNGKGTKVQVMVDGQRLRLGVSVAAAPVGEPPMVQQTLPLFADENQTEGLIGDKGHDSDPLDALLLDRGIEMIAPHCSNRRAENRTQRVVRCDVIATAGSSSAPLPGSATTANCWCAGRNRRPSISASRCWVVR
jgi:hypothetical protein